MGDKNSHWLVEVIWSWGPAILAVILIRTFIFEPFRIPSGSMVPTLLIGDHVLVTKFSYGVWIPFMDTELFDLADPERGDVIVFKYPKDPSQNYIKRVVGLPGDRVKVRDGKVYINGDLQRQKYLGRHPFTDQRCHTVQHKASIETLGTMQHDVLYSDLGNPLRNMPEITIPADNVFVMGDNRDNSMDSRAWGTVKYSAIKGKAHFVWMSINTCDGAVLSFRGDRTFHSLYGSSAFEGAAK